MTASQNLGAVAVKLTIVPNEYEIAPPLTKQWLDMNRLFGKDQNLIAIFEKKTSGSAKTAGKLPYVKCYPSSMAKGVCLCPPAK